MRPADIFRVIVFLGGALYMGALWLQWLAGG